MLNTRACAWQLAAIALVIVSAACGGGAGSPASLAGPTAPSAQLDVTGFWNEQQGSFVMHLQQSGNTVTGMASFTDRNTVLGQYSATGTLSGTISGSTMTLTEVYQVMSLPGGDPIPGCLETVTSSWTIQSATHMTTQFNQTNTCNGSVVFTKSGSATVVKQS